MKHLISGMILCLVVMPVVAATPRSAASTKAISAMASIKTNMMPPKAVNLADKSSVRDPVDMGAPVSEPETTTQPTPVVDNREKERNACIQNNIGIGNTFVWASRYSNTNNYTMMVEDTEYPDNNICFVKVELKSADPKISVSDIPSVYYEMGRNITCGAWADEKKLEQRILDAKKGARTWATIGGAVGGAALGVGSMELFGNKLIGGAVEGQKDKSLSRDELLRSQLLVLKKENDPRYAGIIKKLGDLKTACDNWKGADKPKECESYKYDYLLGVEPASK